MTTVSPFDFPNFTYVRNEDTATHEVVVGKLQDGTAVYNVSLIRNKFYPNLKLLVASIQDGLRKWTFKDEGHIGVGMLAMAGEVPVVALCGRGHTAEVEKVIPLSNLFARAPLDIVARAQLKKAAAQFLDMPYMFTPVESRLFAARSAQIRTQEEDRKRAEREEKEALRQKRVQTIMQREVVTAFANDGRPHSGVPVVQEEWPMLNKGTRVILVDTIEDGTPIEAFQIGKKPGKNPEKLYVKNVSKHKPQFVAVSDRAPRPVGEAIVELTTGVFEVQLYDSMDDIRAARAAGLNSGTYVAVKQANPSIPLEVLAVYADRVDTIGKYDQLY